MTIKRVWAMPNKNTFTIKPIYELIKRYKPKDANSITIDPFANNNRLADITNDIDPKYNTDFNLDATEFLKKCKTESVDCVLYDPPYSSRQVSEVYKRLGYTVDKTTTSSRYWQQQKQEIGRIVKPDGIVISCGVNSNGISKKYGFEMIHILMVPHGGNHYDTIVCVEKKIVIK